MMTRAMIMISRLLRLQRLQTARLCSSSLLWVLVITLFVAFPHPVSSHGSHHSSPSRPHQQPARSAASSSSSSSSTGRHSAASPIDATSGFHDSKIVHDTEHINEHLQGKAAVNVSEMSLEELEFHYFKMHDFDNNTKLDGLEILKALTHLLPYDSVDDEDKVKVDAHGKTADEVYKEKKDKELSYYTELVRRCRRRECLKPIVLRVGIQKQLAVLGGRSPAPKEIVDNVLADDDINDDGYLTYPEYIIARRREEARELQDEMTNKGTGSKVH